MTHYQDLQLIGRGLPHATQEGEGRNMANLPQQPAKLQQVVFTSLSS